MRCKECNETEILKIYKKDHVNFLCKQGHTWFEDYIDNGGHHKRPRSYNIKLEDTLFPSEKEMYQKVLKEIGKNEKFFTSSSPEEIMNYLTKNCKFNKEDIYRLLKKITKYDKGLRG